MKILTINMPRSSSGPCRRPNSAIPACTSNKMSPLIRISAGKNKKNVSLLDNYN